jgi:tetratricopeptide (TPR) repeat protein
MRMPALVALLIVSLQPPATPRAEGQTASAYRTLVDAYRSNGAKEVEQALNTPIEVIERSVEAAVAKDSGWTWEEIRGAAMLHSEAAIRALRTSGAHADLHIALARRLLDRTVGLSPPQEDFAWRWYMAMGSFVSQFGRRDIVEPLEAAAESKWADHVARRALLRGLRLEWRGARNPRVSGAEQLRSPTRSRLQGEWREAARLYEVAWTEDPSLHAAALHLGRLRMLQGERLEAAALFESARAAVNPAVAYLATLFLGSLDERDGRFAAAEVLYRNALSRIPYGQAAPLALAQLLSRTGRERDAREVLAARVLRPGTFLIEPLWSYGLPAADPAAHIDVLRMEVWK